MYKKISIIAVLVATLVLAMTACSTGTADKTTASPNLKVTNQAKIAGKWQMYQFKAEIASGAALPIQINLAAGDEVDGYYYVETEGATLDFSIAGNTQVYQSPAPAKGEASSDRFSFTATQAQGYSYMMTWENPAVNKEKVSVLIELIYPVTGKVFKPLEAN